MKKLFKEFTEFINKGNALELAIGIIIGSTFTAIINSIVNGIFKPLIELIPGKDGLSLLKIVLKPATESTEAIILDIGSVFSAILTFILTALVLFIILKIVNKIREKSIELEQKLKDKLTKDKENKENMDK